MNRGNEISRRALIWSNFTCSVTVRTQAIFLTILQHLKTRDYHLTFGCRRTNQVIKRILYRKEISGQYDMCLKCTLFKFCNFYLCVTTFSLKKMTHPRSQWQTATVAFFKTLEAQKAIEMLVCFTPEWLSYTLSGSFLQWAQTKADKHF